MRPTYLFVLCPPFSGSTLLYRLLASSPRVSTLFGHGNWAGEGQALPEAVPLMWFGGDARRTWDPAAPLPWDRIRAVWERYWDLSRPVLAEKSPPNLCRADAILEHFGRHGDVAFLGMIRSPYAVKQRAEEWVRQATFQRRNEGLPRYLGLTYEALCADPAGVAARIVAHVPAIGALDPSMPPVPGADGERAGALEDKTGLTRSLTRHRTEALAPHRALVEHFGYRLRDADAEADGPFLPEVEVRGFVPAPPDAVAAAWTDPAAAARWWSRVRAAGDTFAYVAGGPPAVEVRGRWLERTPRRLRFLRSMAHEHHVLDDTVVEVELAPAGAGTNVAVRELRVSRAWRAPAADLWGRRLARLGAAFPPDGGRLAA